MIVFDTHVLLWWVDEPSKLSTRVTKIIETTLKKEEVILVSSMSVWEIFLLVKKGRLGFSTDVDSWFNKVENLPYIQFVPVDNRIAAKSVQLPETVGRDPADRIIVATAVEMGAILITSDSRIRKYKGLQSLW